MISFSIFSSGFGGGSNASRKDGNNTFHQAILVELLFRPQPNCVKLRQQQPLRHVGIMLATQLTRLAGSMDSPCQFDVVTHIEYVSARRGIAVVAIETGGRNECHEGSVVISRDRKWAHVEYRIQRRPFAERVDVCVGVYAAPLPLCRVVSEFVSEPLDALFHAFLQ